MTTLSPALVVQTSFLGDTVLTTPLLAWLAERTGSEGIDVLVTRSSAPLLANNPAIRDVIVYDKRGADRGIRAFLTLAGRLRRARYAVAYLAQGSIRSGALAAAARIPVRIGFATSAGRRFYTERVISPEGEHHASRLLRLGTAAAGAPPPERAMLRPHLYPGATERDAVDRLLAQLPNDERPLIALAPGSVWATKRWPYYAALARALEPNVRMAIVGAADDTPLAREIAGALGDASSVVDATGKLSLLASAELIGRARVIVTNDSAPLHLASAMGTPTIAIFGPTVPEFGFAPLAPRAVVAGVAGLACRPCDRHGPRRCPLGHWRCMREITVAQIADRARDLLSNPHLIPPAPLQHAD